MSILQFGGTFAWISFFGALFGMAPIGIAARIKYVDILVRPLAVVGIVFSAYTLLNGLVFIGLWDVAGTYEKIESTGASGSRGKALGAVIIPIWPYVSALLGAVFLLVYGMVLKNKNVAREFWSD